MSERKKLFSGDKSKPLWELINDIKEVKHNQTLARAVWEAMYALGCKCQEFESEVEKLMQKPKATKPTEGHSWRAQGDSLTAFLAEIETVCKKHGYSLSHEDAQGSFIVEMWDMDLADWLKEAAIGKSVKNTK